MTEDRFFPDRQLSRRCEKIIVSDMRIGQFYERKT